MNTAAATTAASALERYAKAFEERWRGNDALTALRRTALEQFLASGLPTQREEDWKYTSLRRLETRTFQPPGRNAVAAPDHSHWIAHAGPRLAFVNGIWLPALSTTSAQPPGLTVLTLGQWLKNSPDEVAAFIAKHQAAAAFDQLNTAFCEDGVVIEVSANAEIDTPVYIVHQNTAGAHGRMHHPRIFVRTGRNSRCTLIEHYLGQDDAEYLTNAVNSIDVEAGATLTHFRLQQESIRSFHIGTTRARLQRDSRYTHHDFALGAGLARVNIETSLEGPGATASLRGLFAPSGTQHLDSHTRIDHVAPNTASHEEYRGIADGRGRGVFNGKVIVHAGARKIDARQSSRNLLLAPTAEIDTKPELEIHANDVKCSHGATTGQLDPVSLFYLRSRGLSESDARALLIRAFAESVVTSIDALPVREYLERELHVRFGALSAVQS